MYLIVGLGNPENEYSQTRHNMGFDVINKLAKKYEIEISKNKFQSLYGTGIIEGKKVILVKPQTYMNNSGEAVKPFADFFKIQNENIIVIYDDIDILTGITKIRLKGGPGTHNGMKSVVNCLGTTEFPRIRVGTGNGEKITDLINYVVGKLSQEEYQKLEEGVDKGVVAIEEILKIGIEKAMSKLN
mgnify:CR=1 FL=1